MGNLNNFIERMKREKDGFAEIWESNRPKRDFICSIEELRLEKGWSQKDLAEKTGLHQSAIARFESGESNPSLKTILKIVKALGHKLSTQPEKLKMEAQNTDVILVSYKENSKPDYEWTWNNKKVSEPTVDYNSEPMG
jgi:transcriptional regulator with XRE-family HTH domain